jgi:two-component system response regulator VanR
MLNNINILVVEDDEHILNATKAFMQNEGYMVDTCPDGDRALEMFYEKNYQLVILDIMLPGVNGQELLKSFREVSDAPVLMMTALTDDGEQLRAFDNEADDYVTKPFSMQILVKRVEALLRRSGALQKEFRIGKLVLNTESYKVLYDGNEITLTLREFEILLLFVQNKGKVVSHDSLIAKVWGYDFSGDEGTVHTHIKNLRAKLPDSIIKTVRGIGYCVEEA